MDTTSLVAASLTAGSFLAGLQTLPEGRTLVVKFLGGAFAVKLSYRDHKFRYLCERYNLKPDIHYREIPNLREDYRHKWDILELTRAGVTEIESHWRARINFGGLVWVGPWPFFKEDRQRFSWVSYEQTRQQDGTVVDKFVGREQLQGFLLAQKDIYASDIKTVLTADNYPVDVLILMDIHVVNPYKARFRTQHWLEYIHNNVRPIIRAYIQSHEYIHLAKEGGASEEELMKLLHGERTSTKGAHTNKKNLLQEFLEANGASVNSVRILDIDPNEKYQNILLLKATGQAEADRIRAKYEAIKDYGSNGLHMQFNEAIIEASKGNASLSLFAGDRTDDSRILQTAAQRIISEPMSIHAARRQA